MRIGYRLATLFVLTSLSAALLGGCAQSSDEADLALEDDTPTLDIEIPDAPTQPEVAEPVASQTATADKAPQQVASAAGAQQAAAEDTPVEEGWGHLRGRFVLDGTPPEPQPVAVTKDPEYCGKFNLKDESLVVNQENGGVANIVIWLYTRDKVDAHPSYQETANATVELDNEQCRFVPHICVVRTGQTLAIKNSDPIGHNTKVDFAGLANPSFNETLPAGSVMNKQFTLPERLPGLVGCSIHPWMNGRLVVQDHPYVAVTDENGNFEIKNLPEGEWTFQVYHGQYVDEVTRDGKPVEWKSGRFEQTITSGVNDLGELKVKPDVLKG